VTAPKRVQVGPHRYRLVIDADAMNRASAEHGTRLLGRCDNEQLLIVVDPRQAPSQQRETVVHELLHAACDLAGLSEDALADDVEERVVRRLAPVLLQVLVDNPKLVAWLT
jgi:hypothetical protein